MTHHATGEGKGAGVLDAGPFSFFDLLSRPHLAPGIGGVGIAGAAGGSGAGTDTGGPLSTLGALPTSGADDGAAPAGSGAGAADGGGGSMVLVPVDVMGAEVPGRLCGSEDIAGPDIGAAEVDGAAGATGTAAGGTAGLGVVVGVEAPGTGEREGGDISRPPTGAASGAGAPDSFGRAASGRAVEAGISTGGEPALFIPPGGTVSPIVSIDREAGVPWAPCIVDGVVKRCPPGMVENSWSPAGSPDTVGSG